MVAGRSTRSLERTVHATEKTRKPIDELTVYDLDDFPIWEFAIDEEDVEGQDETWVRPVLADCIGRDAFSLSVAADFRTKSGARFEGFMDVTSVSEEICQGSILSGGRYLRVFSETTAKDRRDIAEALALPERDVFPMAFELAVCVEGEVNPRAGNLI